MRMCHCEEPKAIPRLSLRGGTECRRSNLKTGSGQAAQSQLTFLRLLRHFVPRNDKGFLLFEVMISIVIIATGLLYVARSYSSSKDSLQRSTGIVKTSLLLEKKMFEFEEKGEIEEGEKSGDFEEDEEYSWEITAEFKEDLNLNLVTLEVFQKKDRDKTGYAISTYLKSKEE